MALESAEESERREMFSFTASREPGATLQEENIVRMGKEGEKMGEKRDQ